MGETKYFWQETRTKNGERFLVAPETEKVMFVELSANGSQRKKQTPFKAKDVVIL